MEIGNLSYKEFHENYITNVDGTSMLDVSLVLTSVYFVGFHQVYLKCLFNFGGASSFVFDITSFVTPCILLVSVLNQHVHYYSVILILWAFAAVFYESSLRTSGKKCSVVLSSKITVERRAYVTIFKAIISLITVICILAVDFTVFPLKHAKTLSYGYSLMDTGVGFYIFSNGFTTYLSKRRPTYRKLIFSSLPILILGVIRYASVEKMEYQKHVAEYGVHWNFFFTLAFVKLLGSIIVMNFEEKNELLVLLLPACHQVMLCAGVESWIVGDTPRSNWLAANREGIVSLIGYLYLYLAAAYVSRRLNEVRKAVTLKQDIVRSAKVMSVSFLGFAGTFILDAWLPSSRRLVNPTFVLWMLSLCLLVISFTMSLEIFILFCCRKRYNNSDVENKIFHDHLLQSISYNNLPFFLICNILTGVVNISVRTLFVQPFYSVLILIAYMTVSCGAVTALYVNKLSLKFW